MLDSIVAVGIACLAFNVVSMLTGYLAPLALKLPERQAIAITMEIGIHNTALAIYVALNVLNNPAASLVPGIYTLCMYLTATLFALYITRRATAPARPKNKKARHCCRASSLRNRALRYSCSRRIPSCSWSA